MKLAILIGSTVGGSLGSWLGSLMDHGNMMGMWSILFGGIGAILGIWAGYRIGRDYIG